MTVQAPTPADIDAALVSVHDHPQAAVLGTFAYDVLMFQAKERALAISRDFVIDVAVAHRVDHELAATEGANLLTILERGPSSGREVALVSAFAAYGFGERCFAAVSEGRRALADQLVVAMAQLELATHYRFTPFLGLLLPSEVRGVVEDALLEAILNDDSSDSAARARNAARLTALTRAQADAAHAVLARIRDQVEDPTTRAVVLALLAEGHGLANRHKTLRVHGVTGAPARRMSSAIVRWLSGIALLGAIVRVFGSLIGLRREGEVELQGGLLRVRERTTFYGRVVRSSDACYTLDRISGATRRARFALLRSAVGMISLAAGVLLGGHLMFDGARGGAPLLLIGGACVALLGAALDLSFEILWPARTGRVELQIDLEGARSLRLSRVPLIDADQLLSALAERVALSSEPPARPPLPSLGADATPTSNIG